MYCMNCGKKINDGDKFCPFCGSNQTEPVNTGAQPIIENTQQNVGINDTQQAPIRQNLDQTQNTGFVNQQPAPTKSKGNKWVKYGLFGLGGLLVLGLLAMLISAFSGPSIDMTGNATAEFSGADGYGYVSINNNLDQDEGIKKMFAESAELAAKNGFNQSESTFRKLMDYDTIVSGARYACSWYVEGNPDAENGTLKNGDVVIFECEIPQEALDAASRQHISFKNTSKKFTVEGLQPVEEVDLFEGITVGWTFEEGYPQIKVDTTNCPAANQLGIEYRTSRNDNSVTVRADVYESDLLENGYAPKDGLLEKDFDIEAEPVEVTSTTDDEVKKLAQSITDKLLIADLEGCKYKLTDKGDDNKEKSIKHEDGDLGYGYKGISSSFGSLVVEYTVVAGGEKVSRSYNVKVYKLADGSYEAFSNYEPGNSGCSFYWNDWNN